MGLFGTPSKKVQKATVESPSGTDEEHAATAKIQARVRGKRARRGLLGRAKDAVATVANSVGDAVDYVGDRLEDAAYVVGDYVGDLVDTVAPKDRVPKERIDAPTPEDRWFSPANGWPAEPAPLTGTGAAKLPKWSPPEMLCPTMAEMPALYDTQREVLGELKVEVLQCDNLPRLLQAGRVDPYAVVIFEAFAAKTAYISNDRNPAWGVESPRAFRFPVTCPYSLLHVAFADEDRNKDDPIGRVVIDLGQLNQRTVYDSWYPLQFGHLKRHARKLGVARLRLSLVWRSDRVRLMSFLMPMPCFVVPFKTKSVRGPRRPPLLVAMRSYRLTRAARQHLPAARRHRRARRATRASAHRARAPPTVRHQFLRDSAFAVRGKSNPLYFSWRTFNANVRELKSVAKDWMSMVVGYVFWQYPFVSSVVFVLYQLLVSNPLLLPAAICFGVLAGLVRALITKPAPPPIDANPPVASLCAAVIVGGSTAPLVVGEDCWPDCASDASEGDSDSDEEVEVNDDEEKADIAKLRSSAVGETHKKSLETAELGKSSRSFLPSFLRTGPRPTLNEELERLKTEVVEELEEEQVGCPVTDAGGALSRAHAARVAPLHARRRCCRHAACAPSDHRIRPLRYTVPLIVILSVSPQDQTGGDGSGMWLFPIARLLNPVQRLLVHVLMGARLINRVIAWDDPAFSLLISLILATVASVLALAAWLLHLLPWSLIIEWLIRLLGAAALGPHMYWVGKWVERQVGADCTPQQGSPRRSRDQAARQHPARLPPYASTPAWHAPPIVPRGLCGLRHHRAVSLAALAPPSRCRSAWRPGGARQSLPWRAM